MKTRVLITGASGFVGGGIARELSDNKDLILSAIIRKPERGQELAGYGVRLYEGDISDTSTLKEPLSESDAVIHCAALMSNFDSEPKEEFYKVNILGTENLLRSCKKNTIKHFLHISTAGVYGATGKTAAREDAPYGKRLSTYEWSKMESEGIVKKYGEEFGIPYTILRPSQLYGIGMRYGWPETIAMIRSEKMVIPGKGMAHIHLVNIKDLVQAVRLALLNKKAFGQVYNIAGHEVLTLGAVFDGIAAILKVRPPKRIPYLPVYIASILLDLLPSSLKDARLALLTPHRVRFFSMNHVYDISKARRELGYAPTVGMRDGFCEMAEWCKTYI